MAWSARGIDVVVRSAQYMVPDSFDRERRLYQILLCTPFEHIRPLYGVCTDAPDGMVRLVLQHCAHGSLGHHLQGEVVRTSHVTFSR